MKYQYTFKVIAPSMENKVVAECVISSEFSGDGICAFGNTMQEFFQRSREYRVIVEIYKDGEFYFRTK